MINRITEGINNLPYLAFINQSDELSTPLFWNSILLSKLPNQQQWFLLSIIIASSQRFPVTAGDGRQNAELGIPCRPDYRGKN